MTIRTLSAFVPSAMVVALGAHLAAEGLDHAPGGDHAGNLLAWIGAWLAAALSGAFLSGLLRLEAPGPGADGRSSIATRWRRAYGVVALGVAGTAAYAVIEAVEGHLETGGLLWALASAFPLATIVAALARTAATAAARIGSRLGRLTARPVPTCDAPFEPARHDRPCVRTRLAGFRSGGRAPPLFA